MLIRVFKRLWNDWITYYNKNLENDLYENLKIILPIIFIMLGGVFLFFLLIKLLIVLH